MSAPTNPADPTIVNGINLDDLFALIDDVKREPAKGKTNWHVITTWQGQTRSRSEIESYELGGQKVPRLASIKKVYDPANLFRLNHNVAPAA